MQITQVAPKIHHLLFDTTQEMCESLMRFEEFYESPKFRGQIFTREEFIYWYALEYGDFTYYSDWDGFNIPGECFKPFLEGKFSEITYLEHEVLNKVSNLGKDDYVIATSKESHPETYKHEQAHGLYRTNWKYRWAVKLALLTVGSDMIRLFYWLRDEKYHWVVRYDEMHAYLVANSEEMKDEGLPVNRFTVWLLNQIFDWYK